MIQGIGTDSTYQFTSVSDKSEPKTVFLCRALRARAKERIAERATAENKEMKISVVDVALEGIVEIQNGDQKITKIDEALLDSIPFDILTDVSRSIIERSFVSEAEKKS